MLPFDLRWNDIDGHCLSLIHELYILLDNNLKFRSMILPDFFIDQDTPDNMYKIANLDSSSIEEKVLDVLNSNIVLQKQK